MKKFLAILILLFSVLPALTCGFLFLATNSWILNRQFYIDMIDDERFYDVILQPDLLPADLQTVIESNDVPVPAVTAALREVITPTYMRDQAVGTVNTLFDVFDGKQDRLIFDIDTRPIKESLNGDGADKFAQTLVANLPACITGQEPYAAGGAIMRCIPPDRSDESAVIAIKESLPSLLQKIPDTLHFDASDALQQSMQNSSSRWSGVSTPEELMTIIRDSLGSAVTFTLVIGIFFLLIGMLLWSDTWQGRLQYVGVALVLAAAGVLLLGLSTSGAGSAASSIVMTGRLTINNAPASPEMRQAISAVLSPALSHIGNSFSSTGAVAGGLGAVIFLIGTVLLRPRRDDTYYEGEPMKYKNE